MGLKKLLTQSIIWRCFYFFSVLLVNVFLSRYLQAAGTGNLYFITVIFSFAQVVLSLSGESGIIYFASGNLIERNKLIIVAGVWGLVAGILMSCLVYVYFLFVPPINKTDVFWFCLFGFFYVGGQTITNYAVSIYYTKEKYSLPNILLATVNILFVIFVPKNNAHSHNLSAQLVTCFYFTTFFLGGLAVYISYILYNKKDGAFGFPDKENFSRMLRYAFTALGANIISFLVYKVDYAFVKYSPVCNDADLGNYIQVAKLGQLMLLIPQIIASVVFPRTASGVSEETLSNNIMIIARLLSQIFLAAFVFTLFFGQQAFIFAFGKSFNKMEIPMLILIPGIFCLSILVLLAAYFAGKGNVKINLHAALIGVTVMIIGDSILVPRYGIIAAAAVSTVSYAANAGFIIWNFYKQYKIHWLEFFTWKKSDYNFLLSLLNKPAA